MKAAPPKNKKKLLAAYNVIMADLVHHKAKQADLEKKLKKSEAARQELQVENAPGRPVSSPSLFFALAAFVGFRHTSMTRANPYSVASFLAAA